MRERASWSSKFVAYLMAVAVAASGLAGCIVPEAAPLLGHERKKRILYDVIRGVQCEIRRAVRRQVMGDERTPGDRRFENGKRKLQWFENWQALISLTLRIDDTIAFNPGVSLITPNWLDAHVGLANNTTRPVSQKYNFGIGGGLTYNASRQDVVQYYYPFSNFLDNNGQENSGGKCYTIAGVALEADLKIDDWIDDILEPIKKCAFLGKTLREDEEKMMPFSSDQVILSEECYNTAFKIDPIKDINHEIDFILTFDANATPTWNLVRVSTTSARLFDINRKDTSRLLLTFGPPAPVTGGLPKVAGLRRAKTEGAPAPAGGISLEMLFTHNALLTGSAVRDAFPR
jgi:hypothetical protein